MEPHNEIRKLFSCQTKCFVKSFDSLKVRKYQHCGKEIKNVSLIESETNGNSKSLVKKKFIRFVEY
jgi:hypothetical protein